MSKIKQTQNKLEVETKKTNCRFSFTDGSLVLGHLCFEVLSPKPNKTIKRERERERERERLKKTEHVKLTI